MQIAQIQAQKDINVAALYSESQRRGGQDVLQLIRATADRTPAEQSELLRACGFVDTVTAPVIAVPPSASTTSAHGKQPPAASAPRDVAAWGPASGSAQTPRPPPARPPSAPPELLHHGLRYDSPVLRPGQYGRRPPPRNSAYHGLARPAQPQASGPTGPPCLSGGGSSPPTIQRGHTASGSFG